MLHALHSLGIRLARNIGSCHIIPLRVSSLVKVVSLPPNNTARLPFQWPPQGCVGVRRDCTFCFCMDRRLGHWKKLLLVRSQASCLMLLDSCSKPDQACWFAKREQVSTATWKWTVYCLHGVSGTSLKVKSRLLCKFVLQRGVSMLAAITYKINTRDPCTEGALQSYLWRSRRLEGALTTHNLQLTEFCCYQLSELYNCTIVKSRQVPSPAKGLLNFKVFSNQWIYAGRSGHVPSYG